MVIILIKVFEQKYGLPCESSVRNSEVVRATQYKMNSVVSLYGVVDWEIIKRVIII